MRVTTNSYVRSYLNNLERLQTEKMKNQIRISTGNDLFNTADGPDRIVDIKQIDNRITENEKYIRITEDAINEMQLSHDKLDTMSKYVDDAREIMIDATSAANSGNLVTLGNYMKGILKDMIQTANADYNGKILFGGTNTRPTGGMKEKLENIYPYEFREGEPSEDNPSGIEIIFKGNNEARIINKDPRSVEQINAVPDKAFGEGGTELFDTVLDIVELLTYNNGVKRPDDEYLSSGDIEIVNELNVRMSELQHSLDTQTSILGAIMTRVEAVNNQMTNENLNLAGFRSDIADTDVAKESVEKEQNSVSLEYALKVGSTVSKMSLFDFI